MPRIYWDGTQDELEKRLAGLGDVVSGYATDDTGLGLGLAIGNVIGMAFLESTVKDFIIKSRGGTGEVGGQWAKLKPDTIARRTAPKGTLSELRAKQKEGIRIAKLYEKEKEKSQYEILKNTMSRTEARRRAAQYARREVKKVAGASVRQLLSLRDVDILRDESYLINSLTPGFVRDGQYFPRTLKGANLQKFEITPGRAIVGTNRIGAATHQYGSNDYRNIPARPFFPKDQQSVPESWWENMRDKVNLALPGLLKRYFE